MCTTSFTGSACDECARQGILDSEGSKCPVCSDVANPEELIPHRLFRDKVDRFCSQTGYIKATTIPHTMSPVSAKTTLPAIVLPNLADDSLNFDMPGGHRASTKVGVEPPNLNLSLSPSSYDSPGLMALGNPGSQDTDSPRGTSPPRQPLQPHTPSSTPPQSPGTPTSSNPRSRSPSKRSWSHGTPYSSGRGTPTPTTSPLNRKVLFLHTIVPPQTIYTGAPCPTLLPPSHVLAPTSYYPPPPPRLAPAPALYHHPTTTSINPSVDPLAAFEEAMRKLDSKKASRRQLNPRSPPRAYRVERPRSRSRERYVGNWWGVFSGI